MPSSPSPPRPSAATAAVDALASVLRTLGEFALPQPEVDPAAVRAQAEGWANHVAIAAPPPGAPAEATPPEGKRDWEGLRRFVRLYCQSTARHTEAVVSDLRQTLWLFISNLNRALARDIESDEQLRKRLHRLEELAQDATASDLKREVLETVAGLGELIETRTRRHKEEMTVLGERVRALGTELESARRTGETDPLTGLYNRRSFDDYLARTLEMASVFGQAATLLLIDIDHFKVINDKQGHTTGDEVLKKVADAVVRVFLRKSDFCARYGGDELAVVLRETTATQAETLAGRLLTGVRALTLPGTDGDVRPTVSIGIGAFAPGDDLRRFIDRADRGLYAAKRAGRNGAAIGE